MSADAVRKYGQINHLIALFEPFLQDLAERHRKINIFDAGCGSSYLTFLIAWWFREHLKYEGQTHILGSDINGHLVEKSSRVAAQCGFDSFVKFIKKDLASADWASDVQEAFGDAAARDKDGKLIRPHVVIALHACDVATDQALAFGLRENSDFIAVAPCCQAELASAWRKRTQEPQFREQKHPLNPVFCSPQLRREIAADFTDMLRILLLRSHGYEVTATEFISSVHTPKNRLITAVRRGRFHEGAQAEYQQLKDWLGGASMSLETYMNSGKAL